MISASVLGVTLTVLKIIGFVLLGIIALALLIILEILFVPIRYKVKVDASLEEKNYKGFARASWLLHIFNYSVKIGEDGIVTTFRIFGIPIGKKEDDDIVEVSSPNSLEREEAAKIVEDSIKEGPDVEPQVSRVYVEKAEIIDIPRSNKTNAELLDDIFEEIKEDKLKGNDEPHEDAETENKEGFFTKIKNFFISVKEFFVGLFNTIKKIKLLPGKIKKVIIKIKGGIKIAKDKIDKLEDFINDKENRKAIELIKKEAFFLLGHIRPKKIIGKINFGLEDPAWTGRILGIFYTIFPVCPEKFKLAPDFENECFEGNIWMRGHIRLCYVLKSFIKLKKNKRISEFLKKRKSEDK